MIGCYGVLILLFGMTQVASELKNGFGLLLLAIGNVTCLLYTSFQFPSQQGKHHAVQRHYLPSSMTVTSLLTSRRSAEA